MYVNTTFNFKIEPVFFWWLYLEYEMRDKLKEINNRLHTKWDCDNFFGLVSGCDVMIDCRISTSNVYACYVWQENKYNVNYCK